MGNSARILIAVSQRIDQIKDRNESRDALDQRFIKWLVDAKFCPLPVPNSLTTKDHLGGIHDVSLQKWLAAVKPDAVILSGGNDIGEFPERDVTERCLLSWAALHRLPVLGICRGMQMMGVWAGGSLIKVASHVGVRHILSPCTAMNIWPKTVNSFHNWSLSFCPNNFEVIATSEDGEIEAIRHTELPWEGWMWHPERENQFAIEDTQRLIRLFREH
ncbi:gamma-glutamyl-gamma-aminobutyrate hydrolase family protein [Herminiimonas arsenitoxidans]|uniref:gamma-glutamyl-gamma-aminobutyrate hydrolase family protein n=1 Tax=Herminiimonas arsenitoxidans TaxID=1809410 RepID=UPI00097109B5|nr:gamma-glutamyl-gamma-aminobutyrate hydrolase family protein [Herminiimonas arsenitoxidans]